MRIEQRDIEGGQKKWEKKLEGMRDRWISAEWSRCRATGTDKLRSRWCIIDWHCHRVETDPTSALRYSIPNVLTCSLVFQKAGVCLIKGQNKGYMLEGKDRGDGQNDDSFTQRSLAVSTINTLITVVCDNHAEMLMTVQLWLMNLLGSGPSRKSKCARTVTLIVKHIRYTTV